MSPYPSREAQHPSGLSVDEAQTIIRRVAEKHRARGVLKQLDAIPQSKVERAVVKYASSMHSDETPLVLVDLSFLQNGTAGLLLTNTHLYSSLTGSSVRLSEILMTCCEKPTQLESFLAGMLGIVYLLFGDQRIRKQLVANGEVICKGRIHYEFWLDVLTELGQASRPRGHAPTLARYLRNQNMLERTVAGAMATGMSDDEIRTLLAPASQPELNRMMAEMRAIYERPRVGMPGFLR